MRTQIAKTAHLPAEYIWGTFLTRTPSPFSAGWHGGLLSRKIFFHFYFLILARYSCLWIIFLFFSDSVIVLVWFWLSDYRLIVSIFNISIFTRFGYAWLSSSTRLIFARYSLSVLRYIFLVSISTCFGIADSTLWLFNSLSLLLVINKHLCLCEFVLCLFWLF